MNFNILFIFISSVLIVATSCKTSPDTCESKLNEQDFNWVASNSDCATYERASAELGLAGFILSNFAADGATDNMRTALGIADSVSDWDSFEGQSHYWEALKLTGNDEGDYYENGSRDRKDVEVHYFITLGLLLSQTYISLDSDADGSISESEIQSFAKLNSTTSSSYGSNNITLNNKLQFVKSDGNVYLIDLTSGYCETDSDYDGVWQGSTASISGCAVTASELAAASSGSLSISGECYYVAQIDAVQSLFSTRLSADENILEFLETFMDYVNIMEADLDEIGISSDSNVRSSLDDLKTAMDNGATCSSDTLTEVNQLLNLVNSSATTTQSSYANYNTQSLSQIQTSSDSSVSAPSLTTTVSGVSVTFSCTNSSTARMIYLNSAGTDYTANLADASSDIVTAFANLLLLQRDSLGNIKSIAANDDVITFPELICMQ